MSYKDIFLLFFIAFIFQSCSTVEIIAPKADIEVREGKEVKMVSDEIIEKLMKKHKIKAASISYLNGYQYSKTRNYGHLENNERVDSTSLFQVGEISKIIATMSAISLINSGEITFDTDLRPFLEEFQIKNKHPETFISLRNLLKDRAGFSPITYNGYESDEELPNIDQLLQGKSPAKNKGLVIAEEPVKNYDSSGAGYLIVQKLASHFMRDPYFVYCKDLILYYIEMNSTSFVLPSNSDKVVSGYSAEGRKLKDGYPIYPEAAVKGMWSSSADLTKLLNHLLWAMEGKSGILPQELAEEMVYNQLGISYNKKLNSISSGGVTKGYACHLSGSIKEKKGVVIMTNHGNGGAFINELYSLMN